MPSGRSAAAEATSEEADNTHNRRGGVGNPHGDTETSRYAQQQPSSFSSAHQLAGIPTTITQASAASLAAAAAAAEAAVSATTTHSVVPDLMRVYESMTGASSQNTEHSEYGHPTQDHSQQQSMHEMYQEHQEHDNSSYYHQSYPLNQWSPYEGTATSSITIPPPYQLPLLQASHAHTVLSPPPTGPVVPNQSHHRRGKESAASSSSGRPQRNKRSAAVLSSEDINGGYASSTGSTSGGRAGGGSTKSRRKSAKGASNDREGVGGSTSNNNQGKDGTSATASGEKGKKDDGRWSKRFTWPDDLHRDFVSAIFDVGLKHSSPSSVMEQMPAHEAITTERIKSHLQKYRLHRQKSKKEFMSSYETSIADMNKEGIEGVTALAGGQVAAHLTYASIHLPDPEPDEEGDDGGAGGAAEESDALAVASPNREIIAAQKTLSRVPSQDETQHEDVFVLPRLTDAEKQSPIGTSLGYLMGLFFSLKQQLERQRQEHQEAMAATATQKQEPHPHPLVDHPAQQDQRSTSVVFDAFASELGSLKKSGTGTAIVPVSVPSTTRNLEENSMMKREMQNQMAFQNKMRALKQQELIKYKSAAAASSSKNMLPTKKVTVTTTVAASSTAAPNTSFDSSGVQAAVDLQQKLQLQQQQQQQQQEFQGAGESDGADGTAAVATGGGRDRSASVAMEGEDDFWNTAVVDDELFEFLMSN
jgi:SHAQKYF class myb-like DNA-binding protein